MSFESSAGGRLGQLFAELLEAADSRQTARENLHQALSSSGWLNQYTLHRYRCRKGCSIAVVFQGDNETLCAVEDYKYSRGRNEAKSVPAARRTKTLDGDRHWPGHVYALEEIAEFGGMTFACRHFDGTIMAADALETVKGVRPGRPGAPTLL